MLTVADTAFAIAVIRAEERDRPAPERLFDDPYAAVFAAAGGHAREGTQRFLDLPFFRDGIRLRTRFLDDFVREGVAGGMGQVVLLGAGFDARALRMPELSAQGVRVFEVDFAAQLETKRALLAAAGVESPAGVAYVPCDFERAEFDVGLTESLAAAGFRAGRGALFVWEGVASYLGDAAIDRSLGFMARVGGAGTRLSFDFGRPRFDAGEIEARVARAGFAECQDIGLDEVWRRYLPGEPHEHAWVARMAVASVR